jgi:pimeloyl-ACP methyl ester carboxylesterase
MSEIRINGANFYYEEHGRGPERILFIQGFMMNCHMYDRQVAALKDRYRVIIYDLRGQGQSEVTPGGYGIYEQVEDAARLIQQLELAPCHVVGMSMGGYIAMRLAKKYPQLVRSLTLISTSAAAEDPSDARQFKLLGFIHNRISRSFAIKQVKPILFGEKYLNDPETAPSRTYWHEQFMRNDKHSFAKTLDGILARDDLLNEFGTIDMPTLIISGEADAACDPVQSERMHTILPNSLLVQIPYVGHTPPVEVPETVNSAISDFLVSLPSPSETREVPS